MHILLDADSIVWKASAAVEKKTWAFRTPVGRILTFPGRTKRELLKEVNTDYAFLRQFPDFQNGLYREISSEPVENALQIAKSLMLKVYRRLEELIQEPVGQYIVLLSPEGKTCFRYDIAKTVGYKSRRPPGKPVHWEAVREYLKAHWGARICDARYEADDAIGILATSPEYRDNCVIASIDKDMLTIPGWNYNFDTDVLQWIHPEQAEEYYVEQLLTGDAADSIPGIKNIGKKKAGKLIEQWKQDIAGEESREYENTLIGKAEQFYRDKGYSLEYWDEMCELLEIKTYQALQREDYQGN